MPKLDAQQSQLLTQLDALNQARLCAPYAPIRERLDADTVSAIEKVQAIARTMKDADGVTRPFHLPTPLALAIVRALRGERVRAPDDDGIPVPSR
jgi:hypothetical protein